MKSILYIVCIVCVAIGIAFYWVQGNDTSKPQKSAAEIIYDTQTDRSGHAKEPHQAPVFVSAGHTVTTSAEKDCECCRSALERVRQRRKELELWAREMIAIHGYEVGMKRVTEKSSTLAKRLKTLLEQEKKVSSSVSSPVGQ